MSREYYLYLTTLYASTYIYVQNVKGTGPPDELGFWGPVRIDLDLNKGRQWFLKVLGAFLIFH